MSEFRNLVKLKRIATTPSERSALASYARHMMYLMLMGELAPEEIDEDMRMVAHEAAKGSQGIASMIPSNETMPEADLTEGNPTLLELLEVGKE
ncbi:hypothetical protein ABAC460_10135 [Asticcacaulis sp. AC460]|uniref:hypothetical protein n=1 Tax=Asticcacaulis sp. AC460 TaxID=1282360 RepID=UPI0003C3B775|nr:hypothetical protein [Asticcacaulis sp. AC460]ESQ90116.1 hypothetical protein ABAC460_10135 [Asticcacaulis sp. AC460]